MRNGYLFHECDWITFDFPNARTSGSVKWSNLNKRSLIYNKANLDVRKTKLRDGKYAHLIHELRSKSNVLVL